MPSIEGACLECRHLQCWWRGRSHVPTPACEKCGGRLTPAGGREFQLVKFEVMAAMGVHTLQRVAASRYDRVPAVVRDLETNVAYNMAMRAREMAHDARRLFPHLRFEFDTDRRGRPLN